MEYDLSSFRGRERERMGRQEETWIMVCVWGGGGRGAVVWREDGKDHR